MTVKRTATGKNLIVSLYDEGFDKYRERERTLAGLPYPGLM